MKRARNVTRALLLALAILVAVFGLPGHSPQQAKADTQTRTVFVNLFEWKWTDVGQECTNWLGPKGFAAVQVSPPNENAVLRNYPLDDGSGTVSFPWFQRYQPVSYSIAQSRSGTTAEFAAMVNACTNAGVDVYVDAVINHMTNAGRYPSPANWSSSNGTVYGKYTYPDYSNNPVFFHVNLPTGDPEKCNTPTEIQSSDYPDNLANRTSNRVRRCELDTLADLNTSDPNVQNVIANYLSSLVNLGVKGFRIDAAKHMDPGEIAAIMQLVQIKTGKMPYYYLEVIDKGGDEYIHAVDYYNNPALQVFGADVHEFKYGLKLAEKFFNRPEDATKNQTISQLLQYNFGEGWGLMPGASAIAFTDNHDEQRQHVNDYVTYHDGALYNLENVFML